MAIPHNFVLIHRQVAPFDHIFEVAYVNQARLVVSAEDLRRVADNERSEVEHISGEVLVMLEMALPKFCVLG